MTPTTGLSPDDLREIYEVMLLTRVLDDRQLRLNRQGRQGIHLSARGHEASGAASARALDPARDVLVPSHRSLAAVLTFGLTPLDVLLGCLSKASDPAGGGRSMPNHYAHAGRRITSMSSPIGTQIPHGVGAALAARLRRRDAVVLVYLGDGAASKGDFHEGLNFAAIHRLPVVFVCENNGWSISVPVDKQMPTWSVAERGPAYGMAGVGVDGTDVLAVYEATKVAVDRARACDGPTLIESRVERLAPHSSDDDDTRYRPPEERLNAERRDPVPRFGRELRNRGLLDDALEAAMRRRVAVVVDEALASAERASLPEPEAAFDHVYADRRAPDTLGAPCR